MAEELEQKGTFIGLLQLLFLSYAQVHIAEDALQKFCLPSFQK